jgi:signal transduction histidine kinase
VWLRVGDELRVRAGWPDGSDPHAGPVPLADGEPTSLPETSLLLPVRDRGELLGALSLQTLPTEPLSSAQEALARNLASQAGLVLRNARLTEELLEGVRELRASRQRIVAAQDHERRRLERNIHDGAQQQLVAIAVKAGLVKALMRQDLGAAERALDELQADTREAVQDLRDLARGIYPPLLADEGLTAALEAQARKVPLPVEVRAEGLGRYPQELEAAVYFCVLEALQNTAKYAAATQARVELAARPGRLEFRVNDDGVGFDPTGTTMGSGLQNMSDRVAALGGKLEVRAQPGAGTTVEGSVPLAGT